MNLQDAEITSGHPSLEPLFLVEEMTHRVLNEYAEAISTLAMAVRSAPDSVSAMALTSAAARLRAHAEAHRALQAPIARGPANLADYIAQLCARLTNAWLAARGVRLTLRADDVWLDADRCWRVGLIVAELVRNAARHGLSGGPGAIRIEIAETSERISCRVRDDGRGTPSETIGRGRRLVQALAGELGGSVDWTFTPSGCSARLEFARPSKTDWRFMPSVDGTPFVEPESGPRFR
jgi:two-component sensor histidine kinase